jgi:hypothetical protein
MKKIIALSLGVGLLLGAWTPAGNATEPAGKPRTGRVLILENERTLTGDVEQVGEQFRVKRLVGETWVPAERVMQVCASLEDAYAFLRGRANLDDPDELVRLGDWCRQHGLYEQARAELSAAAKYRPNDARISRQLASLAKGPPTEANAQPQAVAQAPRVDVTADSLGMFASKVQPILMNACLGCHTAGRGGCFQLTRVSGPGLSNRRSLEQNLATVLAEVNPRHMLASRLLTKAVSVHGKGMTQSPLKNRQAPAYRTLEAWVKLTVENNPQLREEAVAGVTPTAASASGVQWGEERDPQPVTPATTPPPPVSRDAKRSAQRTRNDKKQPISDPVDPEAFNREFHPQRKTPWEGEAPAEPGGR